MAPKIATTPEIEHLIAINAPVCFSVSGGKDSDTLVLETNEELDRRGHTGPRICINSDLGVLEWESTRPHCERLARHVGLPLVVVRRQKGDLLDRWKNRWASNVARYAALSCVQLILPWSSPAMLFCRSELKTAIICRELVRQFPGALILSATGIRREESAARANAPISAPEPGLLSKTHSTSGYRWNPIAGWTLAGVLASHERHGFPLNETYTRYGVSRHSCRFCIMAGLSDLIAAANASENAELYHELVTIEIVSTFSFQSDRWLGDLAPHLLDAGLRAALVEAKERATVRVAAEAQIPRHLLYTKGWPTVMPSPAEAQVIAEVRRTVAAAVGLTIGYTDPDAIRERYAELMAENARKQAERERKKARMALRLAA
jgi:3'-phosphoadenosine 5'-phosphosulfate sulfotransferase (PAPS reductase)/FAD synthetase